MTRQIYLQPPYPPDVKAMILLNDQEKKPRVVRVTVDRETGNVTFKLGDGTSYTPMGTIGLNS